MNDTESGRYKCAMDLPSFRDLSIQLITLKVLNGLAEFKQDENISRIEANLKEMAETVDAFYDLLGNKHWILHDSLYDKLNNILDKNMAPHKAERRLINIYNDTNNLTTMLVSINEFEAARKRSELINKAKSDYFAKRYYSCVMLLLAIVDGFVNELESKHKGFHARNSTEFSDWGSITAHHKGIEYIHREIYTKSISTTREKPVFDLYRNGIMHGTIINFDNIIIATKAWNLLFSVLDWASYKEKAKNKEDIDLLTQLETFQKNAQRRQKFDEVMKNWKAYSLNNNNNNFPQDETVIACSKFLDLWIKKNYGEMASFLPKVLPPNPKYIRNEYQKYQLNSYTLTRVERMTPALAEVTASLNINDNRTKVVTINWIYESNENAFSIPIPGDGQWHLRPGFLNFLK